MKTASKLVFAAIVTAAIALLASPVIAQRARQISDFLTTDLGEYAVDSAGSVAFFRSDVDPLGTNPDHLMQVFKMQLPHSGVEQVTALDVDVWGFSIDKTGSTVLIRTPADPLGTNPDGNVELFLGDLGSGTWEQLTDRPADGTVILSAVLSGGGNRVALVSDADFAGQNSQGGDQVFVLETDGSAITQVTQASGPIVVSLNLAISDDGQRIAFTDGRDLTGSNPDGSAELFSVFSTGAGLRQVTTDATAVSSLAMPGPGQLIVFEDDGRLYQVPFGSTSPTLLVDPGLEPSITDDGLDVYFTSASLPRELRKVSTLGGAPVNIWTAGDSIAPVVSTDGSRLVFTSTGSGAPFLTNPHALQLVSTLADGSSAEQVVDVGEPGGVSSFEMSADGRWIVFPWGAEDDSDLYLADTLSGAVSLVVEDAGLNPAISDDGSMIVFRSWSDLVPEACGQRKTYSVAQDGSLLRQILPEEACLNSGTNSASDHPVISGNGSTVVAQDGGDPAGTDTGGGAELYAVAPAGGAIRQVTNDDSGVYKNPRIDGSGTWAVYHSDSDVTGQNPDGSWEVFRIRTDGTGLEQITADPNETSMRPDISADGTKIVFRSWADPLGTNPEHNVEIFLRDMTTGTTEQLTMTAAGDNKYPRISPNGEFVAIGGPGDIYRLELASGELQLASMGVAFMYGSLRQNLPFDIDDAGNVAFYSFADPVRRNRDGSLELWLAEFDVAPTFSVGAESPTVLRWDPYPWALSYDVIRGDLAALAAGAGGTVDLGDVVCLEAGSSDATTIGHEDTDDPLPGEGFFFLYRGDPGELVGPGSWGFGSAGAERAPSSGDCSVPP